MSGDSTPSTVAPRRRVAIAGATGFVGRALLSQLTASHDVIALGRSAADQAAQPRVEWRACDLFNLREAEGALAGADVALYLVHSMMPSARLTQARFDDLDLICADNFARAARANRVGHIVYLGGLLPERREALSLHLESRLEVERALASHGVPLTTLRAGLIVGAGGSSFEMLARLVGRLPFMVAPRWTASLTQPIAIEDVVMLLLWVIGRPDAAGHAYDIGGPDVVTYADLLRLTGAAQHKRTRVLTLPIRTVKLSLLWISLITGAPQALIRPLVESLKHDMVAGDGLVLQRLAQLVASPLRRSLEAAIQGQRALDGARRARPKPKPRHLDRRACSVQRLYVGPARSAADVATEYTRWLPRFLRPFLRVAVDAERNCRFYLWPLQLLLLELTFSEERSAPDRQLFFVTAGLLSGRPSQARPRLEFRQVLGGAYVLAAVLDFVPRLPWFVYKYTQAIVHLWVMRSFARHLARGLPV